MALPPRWAASSAVAWERPARRDVAPWFGLSSGLSGRIHRPHGPAHRCRQFRCRGERPNGLSHNLVEQLRRGQQCPADQPAQPSQVNSERRPDSGPDASGFALRVRGLQCWLYMPAPSGQTDSVQSGCLRSRRSAHDGTCTELRRRHRRGLRSSSLPIGSGTVEIIHRCQACDLQHGIQVRRFRYRKTPHVKVEVEIRVQPQRGGAGFAETTTRSRNIGSFRLIISRHY